MDRGITNRIIGGSQLTDQPDDNTVEYQPMIRDLPESERPRERLKNYGASALSTS